MKLRAADTFDEKRTSFLNVDLDIISKSPLEPLVAAFGKEVDVLYVGRERSRYRAHLEIGSPKTADEAISALVTAVNKLPKQARRHWKHAQVKNFNIGIQGGLKPWHSEFPLQLDTLRAVIKLGARVVVTVYAARPESRQSQQHEGNTGARTSKRRALVMMKSDKRRMG